MASRGLLLLHGAKELRKELPLHFQLIVPHVPTCATQYKGKERCRNISPEKVNTGRSVYLKAFSRNICMARLLLSAHTIFPLSRVPHPGCKRPKEHLYLLKIKTTPTLTPNISQPNLFQQSFLPYTSPDE